MSEVLMLERFDNSPWGFRLTGGLDFGTPLTVLKVIGGSIAEMNGVKVGDLIMEINGRSAKNLTHIDAQNCIIESGDRLLLSVMRGSEGTPPGPTPLRGMTPLNGMEDHLSESHHERNGVSHMQLSEKLNNVKQNNLGYSISSGSLKEFDYESLNEMQTNESIISLEVEHQNGMILEKDPEDISELEIAELLTGNEEVLDQGVLGINFKKYHPQVDFIRESEVFKGHTVLWLFLGESGEHVVDERWGTPEEERINLSRNEDREDDQWSMTSSELSRKEGHEIISHLDRKETPNANICNKISQQKSDVIQTKENAHSEEKEAALHKLIDSCSKETELGLKDQQKPKTEDLGHKNGKESSILENSTEGHVKSINTETEFSLNGSKIITEENIKYVEKYVINDVLMEGLHKEATDIKRETNESYPHERSETIEDRIHFEKQLAEIQAKIAELKERAPGDLQTQLLEINQQLTKIVQLQTMNIYQSNEIVEVNNFEDMKMTSNGKINEVEEFGIDSSEDNYEYEEESNVEKHTYNECVEVNNNENELLGKNDMADYDETHIECFEVRKIFNCTSFFFQAVFIFVVAHATTPLVVITCLTLSLGFGGLSLTGFAVNHLDIGHDYAGILFGISNTAGTLPGIISPTITGFLVKNKNIEDWKTVFYIAVVVYSIGCVAYWFMASGEAQPWSKLGKEKKLLDDQSRKAIVIETNS